MSYHAHSGHRARAVWRLVAYRHSGAGDVHCFHAAGAQPPPGDGPGPGEAATDAQREGWWLVGWLSCEVAQGPMEVLGWGLLRRPSSAVRLRIVVTSPRPRGPAPPGRGCGHGAHVGTAGGSSPDPVVCPLFAGATSAQPADAALTAGSSLQPLAQPSRRRGTLARGRVASRGRPARVPQRAGGWDKQQGGATNNKAGVTTSYLQINPLSI